MAKEIETKFKIKSPGNMRKKIISFKGRFISRACEKDVYYGVGTKSRPELVIRVRDIGRDAGMFTIKLPPERKTFGKYKIRDEYQLGIKGVNRFKRILEKSGFYPLFRKEKIREEYKLGKVAVLLDRLPYIEWYMEIEGPKAEIEKTAKMLGISLCTADARTYMDIFDEYKKKAKKMKIEMVFKQ